MLPGARSSACSILRKAGPMLRSGKPGRARGPAPSPTMEERARFSEVRASGGATAQLHYGARRGTCAGWYRTWPSPGGQGHHTDMKTRTRLAVFLMLLAAAGCATSRANRAGKASPPAPLDPGAGQLRRRRHGDRNPGTYDRQRSPAGQTFHGDHAYVFYQVPVNARQAAARDVARRSGSSRRPGRPRRTGARASKHLPAPPLPGLPARPAAPRRRGPQHACATTITPTPDEQLWFNSSASASGPTSSPACSSRATRRR